MIGKGTSRREISDSGSSSRSIGGTSGPKGAEASNWRRSSSRRLKKETSGHETGGSAGCRLEEGAAGERSEAGSSGRRKRLLVTGAGGFCGSHAVRHFARAGWEIVACVRPGSTPFWADPAKRPDWFVAADAVDATDAMNVMDAVGATDAVNAADSVDAPGAEAGVDSSDVLNASDVSNSLDAPDALDASNAVDHADASDDGAPGSSSLAFASRPGRDEPEWLSLVRLEALDLSEPGSDSLSELLRRTRPDAVLHLAGLNAAGPSWADPSGYLDLNLMGTVRLLEAVRASGHPCRIVVAGSMLGGSADGPPPVKPLHPYALSKAMQAQAALGWHALYGLDVLVAIPSNLVGPGPSAGLSRLLARYAAACERTAAQAGNSAEAPPASDPSLPGRSDAADPSLPGRSDAVADLAPSAAAETQAPPPFRLSSATEARDFLDVRDAMTGYETLLERGAAGRSYAMASGRMTPLGELAELYRELAAVPLPMEIGGSTAASPEPIDASALRALGWAPRIPLRQSAQDTLEDCRAAGSA
ncbi:NAD-dependent epimerase/dehydratase family protein [Paenibacillus sp. B01]|uniref:NAD-dependent epimerase/dehydratase family protein n=1 Tax=Paenibacillus sp. B01 TaxID=2660554 RepID=UPI0018912556|nr:NAD-dependent epimerase/dehydratase family protein [Paenibacillus sp. B01]